MPVAQVRGDLGEEWVFGAADGGSRGQGPEVPLKQGQGRLQAEAAHQHQGEPVRPAGLAGPGLEVGAAHGLQGGEVVRQVPAVGVAGQGRALEQSQALGPPGPQLRHQGGPGLGEAAELEDGQALGLRAAPELEVGRGELGLHQQGVCAGGGRPAPAPGGVDIRQGRMGEAGPHGLVQGPQVGSQGRELAGARRVLPLAEPLQPQGLEQALLLLEQGIEGAGPLGGVQVLGPGGPVEGPGQQVGGSGHGRGFLRPSAPEDQGRVDKAPRPRRSTTSTRAPLPRGRSGTSASWGAWAAARPEGGQGGAGQASHDP